MNALTGSWKTSTGGILTGGLIILALAVYKPGMTAKQWAVGILMALSTAATGVFAQDHKVPTTTSAGV